MSGLECRIFTPLMPRPLIENVNVHFKDLSPAQNVDNLLKVPILSLAPMFPFSVHGGASGWAIIGTKVEGDIYKITVPILHDSEMVRGDANDSNFGKSEDAPVVVNALFAAKV